MVATDTSSRVQSSANDEYCDFICDHQPSPSRWFPPLSDRICDAVCCFLAVWTLCCHLVVYLKGSLHLLLLIFGGVGILWLVGIALRRRLQGDADSHPRFKFETPPPESSQAGVLPWGLRAMGFLTAVAVSGSYIYFRDVVVFWWMAVIVFSLAMIAMLRYAPQPDGPLAPRRTHLLERDLWLLGLACAFFSLVVHRSSMDDGFYLNVSVTTADRPTHQLLRGGIHGLDIGTYLPIYKIHSFEVLIGAVSYLSSWVYQIPVIKLAHWGVAASFAFLMPLALARFFRLLVPQYWFWPVVAVLVVLIFGGEMQHWFGNLTILRMWQGKCVFLGFLLPLIYAYGMQFGYQPSLRSWLMLTASIIAGVGCTSTALWIAPVSACLATACTVRLNRRTSWILLLAVLACGYVVSLGLTFKGEMTAVAEKVEPTQTGERLQRAIMLVLGEWGKLKLTGFALGSMLAAWALYRRGPVRRFAILVPLIFLLFILNPYFEELIRKNITGPSFKRAVLALPLPILMGLLLASPIQFRHWSPLGRRAVIVLGMIFFAYAVPRYSTMAYHNRSQIGKPKPKVPESLYRWANLIYEITPPRGFVVGPTRICVWIPTFHRHPYPLVAREYYLERIAEKHGNKEAERRLLMSELVSTEDDIEQQVLESEEYRLRKNNPQALEIFTAGLDKYQIETVCLNVRAERAEAIRLILKNKNFNLVDVQEPALAIAASQPATQPAGEGDGITPVIEYPYEIWLRRLNRGT